MDRSADIAIVGAGIIGLAHAYMALKKGYRVVLFEREQFAVGASVRNFGLLWPIGQEPVKGLHYALKSREHWLEVSRQAGIWNNNNGSLHVVYHDDEMAVLEEFMNLYKESPYQCSLLGAEQVMNISPMVNRKNLKGGLFSETEGTVYSREAIRRIPLWLEEKFGLVLRFGNTVKEINLPHIKTNKESWKVDKVIVCSGADFETLYPEQFEKASLTKCKLQMMKAVTSTPVKLGPSLCAGLTLHYSAFSHCPSLENVHQRYDRDSSEFKKYGIHVLLAQNNYGEFIIGDSHEYGLTLDPFDQELINDIILKYLSSFITLPDLKITERWNGIYPKASGKISFITTPEKDVTIVNGLGGAGMTLGFGLAEEVIENL